MSVIQLLFPLLIIIGIKYKTTDGVVLPSLDAELVKTNITTLFKFQCTVLIHPVDSLLHFLVNDKSMILFHTRQKTCYTQAKECIHEKCNCSYKNQIITWYYPVNNSRIDRTFAVVMRLNFEQIDEVIKLKVTGIFEKSVFRVNESSFDVIAVDKKIILPKCTKNDRVTLVDIFSFVALAFGGLGIVILCILRTKKCISKHNFSNIIPCRDQQNTDLERTSVALAESRVNEIKPDFKFWDRDQNTNERVDNNDSEKSTDDNSEKYYDFSLMDYRPQITSW